MSRYDTDPKYRKAVDEALIGGPSQKSLAYRKKMNEQPKASTEELINQVQKEFSEDKITTQKRPSALDKATTNLIKAHVKYDDDEDLSVSYNPTTKIFSNKSRTIGFQKYEDADKYNKLIGAKKDLYPEQATPEQVGKLAEKLEKYRQTNGDRKARKYILNQIKNKTTVPEFKLNTEIPKVYKPEPPTPEQLEAERKFNKMVEEDHYNKTRGLANLMGVRSDKI